MLRKIKRIGNKIKMERKIKERKSQKKKSKKGDKILICVN